MAVKIPKEVRAKFKGHETWVTSCDGHEIKVINRMKARMYIDGIEVAKEKGISTSSATLSAEIPDTNKTVAAIISSEKRKDISVLKCKFIIGEVSRCEHGFSKKDGTFDALTEEEEALLIAKKKEDAEAASIAALISVIN